MMEVEWRPDENEPADFNLRRYDIKAAKLILQRDPAREQIPLNVAEYEGLRKMLAGVSHAGIDLSIPVIVVQINAGLLSIDGWSRITKAASIGYSTIPAVKLTAEEARSIRRD
jgi:hypothetical protein